MKFIPLTEVRDKLNTISTSFCLAKWLQSTTVLSNGFTHSCHHPHQHKIDFNEVQKNHLALHNTPQKIAARHDLLNNIQTPECDYCWRVENIGNPNIYSDRINKSSEVWAMPYFNDVIDSNLGENIYPKYLEVSFENTCNFACYYCLPEISSRILGEVESKGPYVLATDPEYLSPSKLKNRGAYPIHRDDYNPYTEAFWKWWPDLKLNLLTFRITGGEPLLSKHTWKIFDDLIEIPHKELIFAVNSNFGVPDQIMNSFISKIPLIANSVKSFEIYTSAEATGKQQEYIRYGMIWETFKKNVENVCETIRELNNVTFVIMATVNILSVTTFTDFLDFVICLKDKYSNGVRHKIVVSINFLRHPEFGCLTNLEPKLKTKYSTIWLNFLKDNEEKLNDIEINQFKRLIEFMNSAQPDELLNKNLKLFFTEYDKRKGLNFNETFTELSY